MAQRPFPSLHIKAFRGLRDLHLEDCEPVNLLVGGNNCGKTSVLEAILLLANPYDPRQWEGAVELRKTWPFVEGRFRGSGIDRLDALAWLFPHGASGIEPLSIAGGGPAGSIVATVEQIRGAAPDRPVVSEGEWIEGSFPRLGLRNRDEGRGAASEDVRGLEIAIRGASERHVPQFRMVLWERGRGPRSRPNAEPGIPIAFATPISHRSDGYLTARVSRLLRAKKKTRLVELLKGLDPEISDLVVVSPEDSDDFAAVPRWSSRPTLHVEHDAAGLVPVHAMGDGIRRAMHFAALVADVERGGVLLVDEIEVGMHTTVLRDVFTWLCESCRASGVQLFAATHSLEAVDAILEGVPDEDIALYRLRHGRAKRFGGELLRVSRMELGQEIR